MRLRRLIHGALLTASLFSIAVPPALGAVSGGGEVHAVSHFDQSAAATAAYWTPARMAAATPVTVRKDDTIAKVGPPAAMPSSTRNGSKVVGALSTTTAAAITSAPPASSTRQGTTCS